MIETMNGELIHWFEPNTLDISMISIFGDVL